MSLADFWATEGPLSYLGLAVAGFPNLFIVQAPGSPSAATNFVAALEQHVEWIGDCIAYLRAKDTAPSRRCPMRSGNGSSTPRRSSRRRCWSIRRCNSWYNGGNVPGKKRMYMGYTAGSRSTGGAATRSPRPATPASSSVKAVRTRLAHRPGFRRCAAAGACRVAELRRLETAVAARGTPVRRGGARRARAVRDDADGAAAELERRAPARPRPTSCRRSGGRRPCRAGPVAVKRFGGAGSVD